MAQARRDSGFRIRLTAEELRMLHELAEKEGISAADVLRLYIRRAHAAAFSQRNAQQK